MPSEKQTGANSPTYDTREQKMLSKNDLTVAALIQGIRDRSRVTDYIEAEMQLADKEDRDPRQDVIGALNRMKKSLEAGDGAKPAKPGDMVPGDMPADTPDEADDTDTAAHDRHVDDRERDPGPDDAELRPYPKVERYETIDALEQAAADHDGDTFTTSKPEGELAGCFTCESHIGFVPEDDT